MLHRDYTTCSIHHRAKNTQCKLDTELTTHGTAAVVTVGVHTRFSHKQPLAEKAQLAESTAQRRRMQRAIERVKEGKRETRGWGGSQTGWPINEDEGHLQGTESVSQERHRKNSKELGAALGSAGEAGVWGVTCSAGRLEELLRQPIRVQGMLKRRYLYRQTCTNEKTHRQTCSKTTTLLYMPQTACTCHKLPSAPYVQQTAPCPYVPQTSLCPMHATNLPLPHTCHKPLIRAKHRPLPRSCHKPPSACTFHKSPSAP